MQKEIHESKVENLAEKSRKLMSDLKNIQQELEELKTLENKSKIRPAADSAKRAKLVLNLIKRTKKLIDGKSYKVHYCKGVNIEFMLWWEADIFPSMLDIGLALKRSDNPELQQILDDYSDQNLDYLQDFVEATEEYEQFDKEIKQINKDCTDFGIDFQNEVLKPAEEQKG